MQDAMCIIESVIPTIFKAFETKIFLVYTTRVGVMGEVALWMAMRGNPSPA